jgi:hypothetical protein
MTPRVRARRAVATNFQFVSTIERDPGLPTARRGPASPHTQGFSQTGWKPIPRTVATNFQFVEPLSVIPVSHRHDGAQRPRTHRFFHRQAGSLSHGPWRRTSSLSAPSSVIPASQWHDEGQRSHTQGFSQTGWKPIPRTVATNFQFVSTYECHPGLPTARRGPASVRRTNLKICSCKSNRVPKANHDDPPTRARRHIRKIPQRGYFPQPGIAAPAATPGEAPKQRAFYPVRIASFAGRQTCESDGFPCSETNTNLTGSMSRVGVSYPG